MKAYHIAVFKQLVQAARLCVFVHLRRGPCISKHIHSERFWHHSDFLSDIPVAYYTKGHAIKLKGGYPEIGKKLVVHPCSLIDCIGIFSYLAEVVEYKGKGMLCNGIC